MTMLVSKRVTNTRQHTPLKATQVIKHIELPHQTSKWLPVNLTLTVQ